MWVNPNNKLQLHGCFNHHGVDGKNSHLNYMEIVNKEKNIEHSYMFAITH